MYTASRSTYSDIESSTGNYFKLPDKEFFMFSITKSQNGKQRFG